MLPHRLYSQKYGIKLNGVDQYNQRTAPINMDLNGSEMITATDDRTFETTVGNWTGAGTHSIARSILQAHSGSASGLITATGIGDATTNYVQLDYPNFTAIVSGSKFTREIWARSLIAGTKITGVIGDQSSQSVALFTSAWTKVVFNFQATVSTVNQPLRIYLSAIDGVYIDDVSLTQAYDGMIIAFVSPSSNTGLQKTIMNPGLNSGAKYWMYVDNTPELIRGQVSDGTTTVTGGGTGTAVVTDGRLHCLIWTLQRDGNLLLYTDATVASSPQSIASIGKIVLTNAFDVGWNNGAAYFPGKIGECQIIRFTSLPSDIATTIATISARKKALSSYQNGTIVAWYDWKKQGYDKSGNGNHLTLVGAPPIVRI